MAPVSRRTALTAGAGTLAGLSLPRTAVTAKALLAGDATGAFASPNPVNPRVVTHVTSMQSGHGWTAANTSASNLNDTTTYALGTQSASITTRTDGVASTLTKTGLSLNISGTKQLRALIRVDGVDYLQGLNVYVSSDTMVANSTTRTAPSTRSRSVTSTSTAGRVPRTRSSPMCKPATPVIPAT